MAGLSRFVFEDVNNGPCSTPSTLVGESFGDDLSMVEIGVSGLKSGSIGPSAERKPTVLFNLNLDIFGLDAEAIGSAGAGAQNIAGRSTFSTGPLPDEKSGDG